MGFVVYILVSEMLGKFYVGSTQEALEVRYEQHLNKFFESAYTTISDEWRIFLVIDCESITQTIRIEKHIKNMKSKKYIHDLKKYPEIIERLKLRYK